MSDEKFKQAIEPVIKKQLQEATNRGINIGFTGALIGCYKKIEHCATVDEAVNILKAEADRVMNKIGGLSVDELEVEINEQIEAERVGKGDNQDGKVD